MPHIDDLNLKRPFRKKRYRPWNLLDESPHPIQADPYPPSKDFKSDISAEPSPNASNSPAERQPLDSKIWSVDALSGKEAELVQLLFKRCVNAGARQTEKFSSHILCEAMKVSTRRLRNLVERLVKKNILIISSSKRGNGSWRQFTLPNAVYQDMALNHLDSNSPTKRQQLDSDWTATKTAEPPSSSSLYYKTTTTESENAEKLPPLWDELDISPLIPIRFNRNHLIQLAQLGKLTPQEMQDSIYAFAFDLEVNGKGKEINGSALNYFMGILRKGCYAAPSNYESPEVRQQRLYVETKERERKALEELDARLEVVEFDLWLATVPDNEKVRLVPPLDFTKLGSQGHIVQMKEYFREKVWPERRERMFSNRSVNNGESA